MTQREISMFENYINSRDTTLRDVYGSFSLAKQRAFDRCVADMFYHNGYNKRIPTHNSQTFTFAYTYEKDGREVLRYHTAYNVYEIDLQQARDAFKRGEV